VLEEQPLGWVPVEGRGSLPFALVHGESLVAAASWALGEAGVQLIDAAVAYDEVRTAGRDLVLHDPLCPLTPADFLAAAAEQCAATGRVVVGYRPVTDTVKQRIDDHLGETVDRAGLRTVTSPVVIPAAVLAGMEQVGSEDFVELVARLATLGELSWIEAPAIGARIVAVEDLPSLEALSRSLR